jgi:beta-glucosidase
MTRPTKTADFPAGFLWGASTASHQVEGDNRLNDWWAAEQAGEVPYQSGAACEHYTRFRADFDLASSLGHNAHRLSLEWSRVEPQPGEWNEQALEHYEQVLSALRERGIEPLVTLHHFTNPLWFAQRGGWARRDSVRLYLRYVQKVVERLRPLARYWLTINEPTVYIKRGYVAGSWPPLRRRAFLLSARVLFNMSRAHRLAYRAIHALQPDAMVGLAHSAPCVEPWRAGSFRDRMVARMRDWVLNALPLRLLGRSRGVVPLDFLGINYYSRELVRWAPRGLAWLFGEEPRAQADGTPRRFSDLGWEIHPPGLRAILRRFSRLGVPMIITENGIATNDESLRSDFLAAHLAELALAVQEGLDVRGYCYWSLLDNFEWAEGYGARFGLAATDFDTQQRLLRPAAAIYAQFCRERRASGKR